jgi:DNA processing protein
MSGDWDDIRLARAALSWLAEPGNKAVGRELRRLGPVRLLAAIVNGTAPGLVRSAVAARLAARDPRAAAEELAQHTVRLGCRLVVPEDREWPGQVGDLDRLAAGADRDDQHTAPPIALWVRGDHRLDEILDRSVAIVGARAATAYGDHVATEFGYGLADRDWTVVSGGAFGIDAAAHRGALAAGRTVAILACGVDAPYPPGNAALFERIGSAGLLVSEWPPGATPQRHRFLIRNRVIAASCRGTVVVEASARSGARNTARRTQQLGRALMAVPGPVTSTMSVGTHLLIRHDQARLVTCPAEVLEEVGRIGDDLAPVPHGPTSARDSLDPLAARVLDAIPHRHPRPVDRIATESGIPTSDVRRTLPLLVLLGLAAETPTGYHLTPRATRTH